MDKVSRALRVGCGAEDGAFVILEDSQPVGDIGRVILAGRKSQLQIGAQEGGSQLGYEFFFGITFAAPFLAPKFTGKTRRVFGPM